MTGRGLLTLKQASRVLRRLMRKHKAVYWEPSDARGGVRLFDKDEAILASFSCEEMARRYEKAVPR